MTLTTGSSSKRSLRRPSIASVLAVGLLLGPSPAVGATATATPRDQTQIARQSREEARQRAAQRVNTDERSLRHSSRDDASRIPRTTSPTVQVTPQPSREPVVGWGAALAEPAFSDRRRRLPLAPIPAPYTQALHVGERFVFDVYFAGNPAGLAEAGVVEYVADPRGEPPQGSGKFLLEGRAVTSGVISLLSSMEDQLSCWVDADSGAVITSVNILDRSGFGTAGKFKKRVTETDFEGRGHIRIVDAKDAKATKITRQVPRDTFDPLSAMAWVRSLDLDDGETVSAHVLDGKALLKVEVRGRGRAKLDPLPSVAQGLGVRPDEVYLLEGTLSRVDRYGVAHEDTRKYSFRAYVTRDERRLLLAIETDMWLGVLKLVLNRYDPPHHGAD